MNFLKLISKCVTIRALALSIISFLVLILINYYLANFKTTKFKSFSAYAFNYLENREWTINGQVT